MNEPIEVELTVNGQVRKASVPPRRMLADFLRDDLGLTGTHLGCEHGVCGVCTVIVDGQAVRSCLMFAAQAAGSDIRTVEGLGEGGALHPVQEAFHEFHALQCGYCTPGFLGTLVALLEERPNPTDDELRHELSSVLCRCTGYQNIVTAAIAARDRLEEGSRQ